MPKELVNWVGFTSISMRSLCAAWLLCSREINVSTPDGFAVNEQNTQTDMHFTTKGWQMPQQQRVACHSCQTLDFAKSVALT